MGIGIQHIQAIERTGAFNEGRAAVLDLGQANLFHATEDDVLYFFKKYGKRPLDERLRAKAKDLARRSRWMPEPTEPYTFLGEILEETTIDYLAFDVIEGARTRIFDLNFDQLPPDLIGRFDLVFNFGTTEHVFGQYHAFKVMHDALKPNGCFYHQLPVTGFFDHGYFNYNPRLFSELAEANDYQIIDLFFSEPQGYWSLEEWCLPPANLAKPERFRTTVRELGAQVPTMPNGLINAFMRKTTKAPFRLALDRSQGGTVNQRVDSAYQSAARNPFSALVVFKTVLRRLGAKWALQKLGLRR